MGTRNNNRNCSAGGISQKKYYADLRQSLDFRRCKLTIYEKEKKSALHGGITTRHRRLCVNREYGRGHRVILSNWEELCNRL